MQEQAEGLLRQVAYFRFDDGDGAQPPPRGPRRGRQHRPAEGDASSVPARMLRAAERAAATQRASASGGREPRAGKPAMPVTAEEGAWREF